MTALLGFIRVLGLIGLVGCDMGFQEVIPGSSAPGPQEQNSVVAQLKHRLTVSGDKELSKEERNMPVSMPKEDQKVRPEMPMRPITPEREHVLLTSKMYFSKAGELVGDLTIQNDNSMSFKEVTVECVEYDMNGDPVRRVFNTLKKSVAAGKTIHWHGVNLGYVHDDVETVQCGIQNLTADLIHGLGALDPITAT